jgi:type I restriction enzyme S subunit
MAVENLITDHLDIWTAAIKTKSAVGRGSSKKLELVGVKKLRELILELAVRGKLVPQDPNDEPASELLKKIEAEKAQLIKEGKVKKQKSLPPVTEEEKTFELPEGWSWARLQNLSSYIQRGKGPKYSELGLVRVVSQKCVQNTGFNPDVARYVTDESLIGYQPERYLLNNDILWNSTGTGTVGRANVIENISEQSLVADSHVTVIRPLKVYSRFLWCFIMAPGIQSRIEPSHDNALVSGSTKQVELNTSSVVSVVAPLAPFKEQHRIVTKVDELMALCDQLEAQTENSVQAHQLLVETLLAILNNAKDADELNGSWQTISQHFDLLFTTQTSIDQLKQTILQLAVMGKLVKQDPKDEPASELLKRIATEKQQLIKDGKIKKQKPLPPITDEEMPFELPSGSKWIRLGETYRFINGYAFKSEWFQNSGVKLLRNINIAHGETKWNDTVFISDNQAEEFESFQLKVGDIVISLDRPIINTGLKYAVINKNDLPCLLLQRVAKFHSIGDIVSPAFLSRWLESDFFISSIDPGRSNGVPHISTKQLEMMAFPIFSPNEQNRIVAKVDELMTLCDRLLASLQNLKKTQSNFAESIVEQTLI